MTRYDVSISSSDFKILRHKNVKMFSKHHTRPVVILEYYLLIFLKVRVIKMLNTVNSTVDESYEVVGAVLDSRRPEFRILRFVLVFIYI